MFFEKISKKNTEKRFKLTLRESLLRLFAADIYEILAVAFKGLYEPVKFYLKTAARFLRYLAHTDSH